VAEGAVAGISLVAVAVTREARVGLAGLTVRAIPVSPINSKPLDLVWGKVAQVCLAVTMAKAHPTVEQLLLQSTVKR
jgi:hypothetical protein